jgi:nucleoside-diphosphate-sugar epimerase
VKDDKKFVRFLNVSSIAVYTGIGIKKGAILNELSAVEKQSHLRGEAYTYGKIKQDEMVYNLHNQYKIPFVTVRPGVVYGPGKTNIMGRVGIDTFGIFFHIGGSNRLPLSYVDNCGEAIVLCSIKKGIDGEIFNIIDDNIPSCRKFLGMYKKNVHFFPSIRVPYTLFYLMCFLWEKYAQWSKGQLPAVFNRMRCAAHWKGRRFSNNKLKDMVGWQPKISTKNGLEIYFNYLKAGK